MFKDVASKNGSISAEHGIGAYKVDLLKIQKPDAVLNICSDIKKVFDPNGILNPYKMYP